MPSASTATQCDEDTLTVWRRIARPVVDAHYANGEDFPEAGTMLDEAEAAIRALDVDDTLRKRLAVEMNAWCLWAGSSPNGDPTLCVAQEMELYDTYRDEYPENLR